VATPRAAEHRDLEQRLRDLEAALAKVRSAVSRRPQFTVSSGDLTVDGGDVLMLDTDGSVLFRLGAQQFGDRGIGVYRQDGSAALEVRQANVGGVQQVIIRDSTGAALLSESGFGAGLSRPRIPMPVLPTKTPAAYGTNGPEVTSTSGTFETVYVCATRRQNPLWVPVLNVKCSDTTTAAEVRVLNDATGTPLVEFGSSSGWVGVKAAGSTAWSELTPALNVPGVAVDARMRMTVQVRRTAGAGTVSVAVPDSMGG
jgi:hypothetical protein